MNIKRVLIASVILIFFIAFLYFYEIKGKREKEEAEKAERILYDFHGKEVTGLLLVTQKETIELSREEEGWLISKPIHYPADSQLVEQFISAINRTKILEFIEETEKLSQYHLDPPRVRVVLTTSDHERWPSLSLGDEIPLKDGYFAMKEGKDSVLVVSKQIEPLIETTLFKVRDKRLFHFSKWDVAELKINAAEEEMTFRKNPEGWFFIEPMKGPANEDMILAILNELERSTIEKFVAEDPSHLGDFNLSPAEYRLSFKRKLDREWCSILFGKAMENFRYVKRSDRKPVFLIKDRLIPLIAKSSKDFRERKISRRNRYSIKKFTIEMEGKFYAAESLSGQGWRSLSPEKKIIKEEEVYRLLASIVEIKAIDFLDFELWKRKKKSFRPPLMKVEISGDQFEEELAFFQDARRDIYVRNSAFKSCLYKISKKDWTKVQEAFLRYRTL